LEGFAVAKKEHEMEKDVQRVNLKGFDGIIATIATSEEGGPIRRIINGRSRRPTGTFTSVKAGGRAMPYESVEGERRAMWIAEAAPSVRRLLAQPHRIEIAVSGRSRPLIFIPDLLLEVDESAASRLTSGLPFAQALLAEPDDVGRGGARTVVVEIKSDADRRMADAEYRLKLRLARRVYNGLGVDFAVVPDSAALSVSDFPAVKQIVMKRHVAIDGRDIEIATSRVHDAPVPLGDLAASLGSSHVGIAKVFALQVRGLISIDLNRPVNALTLVHAVRSNGVRRAPSHPVWPSGPYARA
jgi:hypothetical protein